MIIAEALNKSAPLSLERRRLVEYLTQQNYAYLLAHANDSLSEAQTSLFHQLLQRLHLGEPLAYVIGEQEFYGLSFKVNPAVLIPRADTELLIDTAVPLLNSLSHPRCLDLGTGSGAIAITLCALCPHIEMTAVDVSIDALAVAQDNASRLLKERVTQLSWLHSDWYNNVSGHYDIIVSNPPYIAEGDTHLTEDGLPFEPQLALTSPWRGTQALQHIITEAPRFLTRPGYLLVEHGYDQENPVHALMKEAGFNHIKTYQDLNRLPRLTSGILR
ncbi:peptide chain release factor N(5)-glutamine methyltransferase [Ferrovum sp. PN-J185]|uniref:peptide chain release factor N(5)-glutamine methyltransferase n=1 Tax=Ferrovum sp. PN-J185 TaxID=1356306 RepID=UPI000797E84C|nr:peptide chain release factor N(5)-glutamine methyltransferase [Ferrovum sp. PN-J185]KXW55513.1 release factor glutamine methyltransferase [Ferrovum sp. PN-J185]